jgi:hypothetical protein
MPKNPTRIEINCTTGVETIIELTDEEVAEMQARAAQAEADLLARKAEAAAKLEAKQAVLAKLGLTAEEAEALLG